MNQKFLLILLIAAALIVGGLVARDIAGNKTVSDTTSQEAAESNPQPTSSAKVEIEDITVGEGEEVESGDTVVMHYRGTLTDGTQFDSSYDRGEPFTTRIGVGDVIQGWDQGVPGMKVGGKRKLTIPPELGYGSADMGDIPPNSTLIFEVELLEIQ